MSEKEFQLKKELAQEQQYSQHLKRMVAFFSVAFGYSFGCLIAVLIILLSTKI